MKSINADEMLLNPLKHIQLLNWDADKFAVSWTFIIASKNLAAKTCSTPGQTTYHSPVAIGLKDVFVHLGKRTRENRLKPIYNTNLQNVLRFVCINSVSLSWFQFYLSSLFWIAIISNYCFRLKNPAIAKLKHSFTKAIRLNIMGH